MAENKGFKQATSNIVLRAIPIEVIARFLVTQFGVDTITNEKSAGAKRVFAAGNVCADWCEALFAKFPNQRK